MDAPTINIAPGELSATVNLINNDSNAGKQEIFHKQQPTSTKTRSKEGDQVLLNTQLKIPLLLCVNGNYKDYSLLLFLMQIPVY